MFILHIEHPVPGYEDWKKAFDADPMNRKAAGVRRFRIGRSIQDPSLVFIDLEFGSSAAAEKMLAALQGLWQKVEGTVMTGPQARIFELTDLVEL